MKWDWGRLIPSSEYHKLVLSKWPGWDTKSGEPYYVTFPIVKGKNKSSRDIAIEWDDISKGRFWYRDYTEDSMPFVENGETYNTMFVFQYKSDFLKFEEIYNT